MLSRSLFPPLLFDECGGAAENSLLFAPVPPNEYKYEWLSGYEWLSAWSLFFCPSAFVNLRSYSVTLPLSPIPVPFHFPSYHRTRSLFSPLLFDECGGAGENSLLFAAKSFGSTIGARSSLRTVPDPSPIIWEAFGQITPANCIGYMHHAGYI